MSMHIKVPEEILFDKIHELDDLISSCEGYGPPPINYWRDKGLDPYAHTSHSDAHDYCHARIDFRNWLLGIVNMF